MTNKILPVGEMAKLVLYNNWTAKFHNEREIERGISDHAITLKITHNNNPITVIIGYTYCTVVLLQ